MLLLYFFSRYKILFINSNEYDVLDIVQHEDGDTGSNQNEDDNFNLMEESFKRGKN
jgi:hypothetical protein